MKTKIARVRQVALLIGLALAASVNSLNAQNTVVTYQGRVTDNGTNFNGTGQFKFALLTSTNNNHTAKATSGGNGNVITFISVVDGGNGYTVAPSVTISGGGGSGATATASISGGVVTGITVNNPGSGYVSTATVSVNPPPEDITEVSYWSNDGTSSAGSEPAVNVTAPVAGGLFTVGLGDITLANMTALDAALFQRTDLKLRIWFNDGVNGFAVLRPNQLLTAAPYAAFACTASSLAAGSNQPLNLTVNGTNVLRLTLVSDFFYGLTANSVGGSPANVISNDIVGGFIGGGGNDQDPNRVGGDYASVLGGLGNTASGYGSTAMGLGTTASGGGSTAMGVRAQALHDGSFVWADSQGVFASTRDDQFALRAGGGVVMNVRSFGLNPAGVFIDNTTSPNGVALYAAQSSSDAAVVIANSGTGGLIKAFNGVSGSPVFEVLNDGTVKSKNVVLTSDRNAKEKFVPVDGRGVLAKIAALPLTEWTYKTDPSGTRHIGPMAQDFHAAFGLNGSDDKHISVVDESGVALAAIQGLNQKLTEAIATRDAKIQSLEQRLVALEKLLDGKTLNQNQ